MDTQLPSAVHATQIDTGRLRMGYRTQGDPDGMPLLLLHGGFASSRWWLPLMACLPAEFRVVAPDLRGCGASDRPADGYSIQSQAVDVAAFVAATGLSEFDLVAHAAGGAVALELLLEGGPAAQAVRSLVLVDSVPIEGVFTPLEALTLLDRMRVERPLLLQAMAAMAPGLAATGDPLFATLVDDAAGMAPAAFTEVTVELAQWNRFADAGRLTLPTLLVWGDQDPFVTREATTRTLIAIPGANNLEVLKGVGHSPMLDAPLALAEKVVDFVTEDFGDYAAVRGRAL